MLEVNRTLQTINLPYNGIDDTGKRGEGEEERLNRGGDPLTLLVYILLWWFRYAGLGQGAREKQLSHFHQLEE